MTELTDLQPFLTKERVIKSIRQFFDTQDFHEVLTPVLQSAVPLEPTIYPFSTVWQTIDEDQRLFLATSPERYLKRMLSLGLDNCYAIGHSFRNLENTGYQHQPEFLMLEWYRKNADYNTIMTDVERLIGQLVDQANITQAQTAKAKTAQTVNAKTMTEQVATRQALVKTPANSKNLALVYQGKLIDFTPPFPRVSLDLLWKKHIGISIADITSDDQLEEFAQRNGYSTEHATWEQLFNQIFLNEIEPHLPHESFFLIDFPARISPLCKPREDAPHLAQRFELYIAGIEIGNGNTEETDSAKVQTIFEQERVAREKDRFVQETEPAGRALADGSTKHDGDFAAPPIDTEFLSALAHMHSHQYAGIGLGVERLVMILADVADIKSLL